MTQYVMVLDTSTTIPRLKRTVTTLASLSSGGGGGGGAINWRVGTTTPAPAEIIEFNQDTYQFNPGAGQYLYCLVKVPSTFTAGTQIQLYLDAYTPSTAGTYLLQTVSSLIRNGTDAAGSTGNQRTSTNTAITAPGTANVINQVICDITDSSGNINGITVNAGDEIEISLARPSGTDTADTRFRIDSSTFIY